MSANYIVAGIPTNTGATQIVGFKDASEALNVTVGLLERGYSAEDIEKICGGNFLTVFREAERLGSL